MGGRIAKSTIQEVQDRLDAVAVVEGYIRLEKRGGSYWGRCPFHAGGQERTPSLKVDPDKKLYNCFGCEKGGGIVGFVMDMEKTDFPETIRGLARRFGVEIAYEEGSRRDAAADEAEHSRREQLFELYRRTAVTFGHFLLERPEGKPALDYLLSRKIDREMIARFRLGYSPPDRNWLYRFLREKGYSGDFLDGSGLFSANYRGMAFFSGRLMFPICDRQGRTVAFGGRALPGAVQSDGREPPKYVNSRETDAYSKGRILYGLDLALLEIRRSKTVYVAEGYMDVIALHQAGVTNAVAPCGTSFTDDQARILRNWADSAVLVFDSDEAGLKAADRGIVACRKNGLACSLAARGKAAGGEEMKDPADILQKFGAETLMKSMQNVTMDLEYLIARGKALYDTSVPQGKAGAFTVLYPYLDALNSQTERDACLEVAADAFRADRESVRADYGRGRRPGAEAGAEGSRRAEKTVRMNDELFLLVLVAVNSGLYAEFRASVAMREIEDPAAKELFVALEECLMNGEEGTEALLSRITWDGLREFVVERGISPEFEIGEACDPRKMMEDGIKRVRTKKLRRRVSEIAGELRLMERNFGAGDDGGDFQDLIAEKMRLDAEIRILEGK
ncbi:MAG: DNA primase [Treponema sp.]|nr:DNA primase [Treponema sp.]